MARLTSPPSFTGTVGPFTVYRMFGRYYIRTRSSLTAKRVRNDPAFRKTMQYAALLAKASRIASAVYALPALYNKKHTLYRKLTGQAMTWLKYGWEEVDIIEYLAQQYAGTSLPADTPVTALQVPHRMAKPEGRRITGRLVKAIPNEPILFQLKDGRNKKAPPRGEAQCEFSSYRNIHAGRVAITKKRRRR